jgi:hypothetical protein
LEKVVDGLSPIECVVLNLSQIGSKRRNKCILPSYFLDLDPTENFFLSFSENEKFIKLVSDERR